MPGKLKLDSRVRDPVHGLIPFSSEERQVIAARPVQRLRGIAQLAFTCLAYPGATHTRFEHSLGVMHLAGRVAERIGLKIEEIRKIRLAALLHDIGHGPFSHASDVPMKVLTKQHGKLPVGVSPNKLHESATADLIRNDPELQKALPAQVDRDWIISVLDTSIEPPLSVIARQIVSGPLDVDKLDYLLRDGLMCGVQYGNIDADWIIDSFLAFGKHEKYLAVKQQGIGATEQVLLGRYWMTQHVYRHKVKRMTDVMLQHAILDASSGGTSDPDVRDVYVFKPGNHEWRKAFLKTDDAWLISRLLACDASKAASRIAASLLERRLTKEVYEEKLAAFVKVPPHKRRRLEQEPRLQRELAGQLAACISTDPDMTFLDVRARDNPLHRSSDARSDESILVVDKRGNMKLLGEYGDDSLCQRLKQDPEPKLYVYAAPLPEITDIKKKHRQRSRIGRMLKSEIHKWFKGVR